ncbi:MAG: extracellular solute-binding protein [Paenibacillus sp.]|nr:extracellular solute-binding protein [Paenibacillus sp.]
MSDIRPKTSPKTRLQKMVATLRDEITAGKWPNGDFIPSELNLCEQFELSRSSVRKGLDQLVAEGYIEKMERVGTKVTYTPQGESTQLVFGIYTSLLQEINITELVHAFHQKYPNIQVQVIDHYFQQNRQVNKDLTQAKGIDVMLLNDYHFETMKGTNQEDSLLLPLEANGGIYRFLTDHFTKRDQLMAQPFVFSPVVLCYNKDHFREAGIEEPDSSWTWEDVREAGTRMTKEGERFGLFFAVLADNRWSIFMMQSGVRFSQNEQGKYQIDTPQSRESLHYYMSLIHDRDLFPAYLSQSNNDVISLFMKQKVSMIVVTYNSMNLLRDAPFEYDIATLPYSRIPVTLVSPISLAISRESKQQVAAKLFVDFLVSEQAQLLIRQQTLTIPALKRAAEWSGPETFANRPSRFPLFREIMPTYRFFTELNIPFSQFAMIREELKFYWAGLDDLDTVMNRIQEKMN